MRAHTTHTHTHTHTPGPGRAASCRRASSRPWAVRQPPRPARARAADRTMTYPALAAAKTPRGRPVCANECKSGGVCRVNTPDLFVECLSAHAVCAQTHAQQHLWRERQHRRRQVRKQQRASAAHRVAQEQHGLVRLDGRGEACVPRAVPVVAACMRAARLGVPWCGQPMWRISNAHTPWLSPQHALARVCTPRAHLHTTSARCPLHTARQSTGAPDRLPRHTHAA